MKNPLRDATSLRHLILAAFVCAMVASSTFAQSGTGVPPVNHAQDARATDGNKFVGSGQPNAPSAEGGVLLGPLGVAGAQGPTGVNDDFTNRSIANAIATVSRTTTAGTIVFRNSVQNLGTVDDVFVITAPSVPAGFAVEISTDDGEDYVRVQSGSGVRLPVAYRASKSLYVRVNAPAGLDMLTGFDIVVRATSTITPTSSNDTIDRLYTGFIRLEKTVTGINPIGFSGPAAAQPGAEIEYAVRYSNVSSSIGSGSSLLTAINLVINENGRTASNHWGETTEHVVGATDNHGGIIIGDFAGSTSLADVITTLGPGESGIFKFRRRVKLQELASSGGQ